MFSRYSLIADGNAGRMGVSSFSHCYQRRAERYQQLSCKVYVFDWHAIGALRE